MLIAVMLPVLAVLEDLRIANPAGAGSGGSCCTMVDNLEATVIQSMRSLQPRAAKARCNAAPTVWSYVLSDQTTHESANTMKWWHRLRTATPFYNFGIDAVKRRMASHPYGNAVLQFGINTMK